MTKLYVNYSIDEDITDHVSSDISSYTIEQTYTIESITLNCIDPYHEEIPFKGKVPDELYVVYVLYSSESTYGYTSGLGSIEGAFQTFDKAQDRQKDLQNGGFSIHGYIPWEGLKSLQSVEIQRVKVLK